ncbi:uncharacterized protein LOC142541533 [Primulina tabacum]|uniref:uncharacterized protein LOC142541533 n=1 Tax=Primulina tabacum TaxID=48773 RepID=UPI003F5A0125
MTQVIVLFRYDGKWKNNEREEPEWCSGLNGGYGAINFDDAEVIMSMLKDQVYVNCGLNKSELELKFSYSTHICDHILGPIYLISEKCLLAYLLLGDTHHRPLLHVEIDKKVQVICDNNVDNEYSHGYDDSGGSKFHIHIDNNCRDDFVDSEFSIRRDNDRGGNICNDLGDYANGEELYRDEHFDGVFIVSNGGIVELNRRTCRCRVFDIDRLPCAHAIAAAGHHGIDIYELCSHYYTTNVCALAYTETIYPIPPSEEWNIHAVIDSLIVLPPKVRVNKERTKKKRIPSVGEFKSRKKKSIV